MQIPIQKIAKYISRYLPLLIILILLLTLFIQRENYADELKALEKKKEAIFKENQKLLKDNEYITKIIEESLLNREKVIEKHYHTKEVINNKTIKYEEFIDNISYNDSIGMYISKYRYNAIRGTAD